MFERYDYLARQINILLEKELDLLKIHPLLYQAMGHSLLARAKRLRAVLLLLTLEAYGFFWQRGRYPALALECIHCYSLIHDDLPCMDDDYLRRGRPTNHLLYGEAMAVLAGDALLTEAFALLRKGFAQGAYGGDTLGFLLDELTRAAGAAGMIGGQVEDLLLTGNTKALDELSAAQRLEKLRGMHLSKTGALLQAPFRLVVGIGGLPCEEMELLSDFGAQFGLVFQIQDDLLDYLGDADTMGKAAGRDARRRKLTYPSLLGLEDAQRVLNEETGILRNKLVSLNCHHENFMLLIDALDKRQS